MKTALTPMQATLWHGILRRRKRPRSGAWGFPNPCHTGFHRG